jgi:hypothetical protein
MSFGQKLPGRKTFGHQKECVSHEVLTINSLVLT